MIQIQFKNLDPSAFAKQAVIERLEPLKVKFPDLRESKIRVTLEMENSPSRPGPDLFTIKLQILQGRYRGIMVSKSERSFYAALAKLAEHMLEKLNRFGDHSRVRDRSQARKWLERPGVSQKQITSEHLE